MNDKDKLIDTLFAYIHILKHTLHLSDPNRYFGMKCELEAEIEQLKTKLGL